MVPGDQSPRADLSAHPPLVNGSHRRSGLDPAPIVDGTPQLLLATSGGTLLRCCADSSAIGTRVPVIIRMRRDLALIAVSAVNPAQKIDLDTQRSHLPS